LGLAHPDAAARRDHHRRAVPDAEKGCRLDPAAHPAQRHRRRGPAPTTTLAELYEAAAAIPELEITSWDQFDRIDVRSDRGVVKFIAPNRWEAQIDMITLEVLSLDYRRSDLIEQIHDGSFFADWVKTFIFLPVGVVLLILWLTGIWMFFEPYVKRYQRKKRREARAAAE
jgi:hypothetical protein